MAELHETRMGKTLIDSTFPKIAKELKRIADTLESIDESRYRKYISEIAESMEGFKEDSIFRPVLETSIHTMEFTVRTHNCLQAAGIRTIEELVKHNASELLRYKNFGRKCLDEIYYKLKLDYGIELKNYKGKWNL